MATAAFSIRSTTNRQKCYSLGTFIFGSDVILPIKHMVDWELVRQEKQAQINKDNIRENIHRVDHDYKVRDNNMLNKDTTYKYETPYTGPFVITQCFINDMLELQYGATKNIYNIHRIKPYKPDNKDEYINI